MCDNTYYQAELESASRLCHELSRAENSEKSECLESWNSTTADIYDRGQIEKKPEPDHRYKDANVVEDV